jgi:hypothetical protein
MTKRKLSPEQAKRERAERRAKKRREAAQLEADRALVTTPREVTVLLPAGAEPPPQAGPQEHRLSDALLDVMRPFVAWPPAARDLKPLKIMLELTVAVWNATLAPDEAAREAALDALAAELTIGALSPGEVRAFVGELAARKLELYPSDRRLVVESRVRLDGEKLLVTAAGAYRPE